MITRRHFLCEIMAAAMTANCKDTTYKHVKENDGAKDLVLAGICCTRPLSCNIHTFIGTFTSSKDSTNEARVKFVVQRLCMMPCTCTGILQLGQCIRTFLMCTFIIRDFMCIDIS